MHIFITTYVCANIPIYTYVCTHARILEYIRVDPYKGRHFPGRVWTYTDSFKHADIYIYIYMPHTHTHTYTHTHTP